MPSPSVYGFNTPDSEAASPAGVWQGLKENTTAHGIPHINKAKGPVKKMMWSLISLTVLGAMVFHLYSLLNTYFLYKVNVHVDMVSKTHLVFPAVTVCNMNPIKNSLIPKNEALSFLLSGGQVKRRRKRQTTDRIRIYKLDSSLSYQYVQTLDDTVDDLGGDRNKAQRIIIEGESAWVVSAWNVDNQFFCPGTYEEDMSGMTVLQTNADAVYRISHACGEPTPATGSIDTVSDGNTCNRDYTITCDVNTPFKDDQTTKTLTCTASHAEYGGSFDTSQISDCFDAVILYGNSDTSGANFIVTADRTVDFNWQNRTSAVTITGPNYWVLYKDAAFSVTKDYYSLCPGEYQAPTDFDDDSINSMTRGTGPLCPTVAAYSNTLHSIDSTTSCWTVNYTCDSGYSFSDGSTSNSLTCKGGINIANGTWVGAIPSCEAETTTVQLTTSVEPTTTVQPTTVKLTTTSEPTTTTEETTVSTTTLDISTTQEAATSVEVTTTVQSITTAEKTTTESSTSEATTTTTYPPELGQPRREDFLLQENIIETLGDMPEEEKSALGYQSTDMLLDCSYEGRDCDMERDFAHFYDPVLGNCYTFNSGRTEEDLIYSYRTGQRYGLCLVVNIDQSEYIDTLAGPAGARIVIHNQHAMPFPNDIGVLANPGEVLSVGVRKVNIERKPHPYGNCTANYFDDLLDMYVGLYGVGYTEMGCTKTCYQREVVKSCGCGDPTYPLYGKVLGYENVDSCSVKDLEQVACQIEMELAFTDGHMKCECRERCSDSYYTTDVSTAQWPATKHEVSILHTLETNNPNFSTTENFTMSDNLLKVEVYFQDFNFEEVVEKPAYLFSQLLSDLGGAFGLWFGLSILSFFEFFEFFLDMSVMACFRCCNKNPDNKRPWQPPSPAREGHQSSDPNTPPPPYKSRSSSNSRRIKPISDSRQSRDAQDAPRYYNYLTPVGT